VTAFQHRISWDCADQAVTAQQASLLMREGAIYACDDCSDSAVSVYHPTGDDGWAEVDAVLAEAGES
jgi:hypothetical protein